MIANPSLVGLRPFQGCPNGRPFLFPAQPDPAATIPTHHMIAMLVYAVGTGARREAIDRKRVLLGPTVGGGLNGYSGSRLNAVRFRG